MDVICADDIFKLIFLNENSGILVKVSPKFVPKCPINKLPTLVQIMACCLISNKPLFKPMMA